MKILVANIFYAPDDTASGLVLTDLATGLAARGHRVTAVASRVRYLGGARLPARDELDGVRVVRPWSSDLGRASSARRMLDFTSLLASMGETFATIERPDVAVTMTSPPMLHAVATEVFGARGVPCVLWMQDLYPELPAALGMMRRASASFRALEALNARALQRARAIVAISSGMRDRLIEQGARPSSVVSIENWADGAVVAPSLDGASRFRARHGLGDRFVVMYAGNLGVSHDVETTLEAARLLSTPRPEVLFVFVGGGVGHEVLRRARLDNVRLLPYVARSELAGALSAGDVHLVTLRDSLAGLMVPSKVYGALAVGRPVLYVGPEACDLTRTIREHRLGARVAPGDGEGLAQAIARLRDDPSEREACGARARSLFARSLDKRLAIERFDALLRGL